MVRGLRDMGGELCLLQRAPHPTPLNTTSGKQQCVEQEERCAEEGRVQWEAAGFPHLPPGRPSGWPHQRPDPEAPSPSGSRGPPQWPPGSAGPLSYRWTAGTGYTDCHSSDLPGDTRCKGVSAPSPPNLPKPLANQVSRPEPVSACCVILSKRPNLSCVPGYKTGRARLVL